MGLLSYDSGSGLFMLRLIINKRASGKGPGVGENRVRPMQIATLGLLVGPDPHDTQGGFSPSKTNWKWGAVMLSRKDERQMNHTQQYPHHSDLFHRFVLFIHPIYTPSFLSPNTASPRQLAT